MHWCNVVTCDWQFITHRDWLPLPILCFLDQHFSITKLVQKSYVFRTWHTNVKTVPIHIKGMLIKNMGNLFGELILTWTYLQHSLPQPTVPTFVDPLYLFFPRCFGKEGWTRGGTLIKEALTSNKVWNKNWTRRKRREEAAEMKSWRNQGQLKGRGQEEGVVWELGHMDETLIVCMCV